MVICDIEPYNKVFGLISKNRKIHKYFAKKIQDLPEVTANRKKLCAFQFIFKKIPTFEAQWQSPHGQSHPLRP